MAMTVFISFGIGDRDRFYVLGTALDLSYAFRAYSAVRAFSWSSSTLICSAA
jgi:hypothetical protein